MTIANTVVYRKVKRINPESLCKKKFFFIVPFFSFYCIILRRWMLAEPIMVVILQYI